MRKWDRPGYAADVGLFPKKAINLADQSSLYAGLLCEQAQSVFCCGTEDKNEAVAAFFEKRKPV